MSSGAPTPPNASAVEVVMPRLSDSMEDGTILSWLKQNGQRIDAGEDLVEIETDKATMTYAAEASGYLQIAVGEGETVAVGVTIAALSPRPLEAGESGEAAPKETLEPEAGPQPPGNGGSADIEGAQDPPRPHAAAGPVPRASPLARRLAQANGIDLAAIQGSGPGGRVTRADIEARVRPDGSPAPGPAATAPPEDRDPAGRGTRGGTADGRDSQADWLEEPTAMQRRIAERMVQSKTTVPDFGLLADVDMTAALELRGELKRSAGENDAVPSLNDLVIKAAARALVEFPRANGSFREGRFELHDHVNVGFAVAVNQGLLVPTIADADRKPLGEIATESRALAERARSGEIRPEELSGGTFTVSNLGMYGMRAILPVINPGEAAILGVGALEQRVVAEDGAPVVRPELSLSLICDHRILYGAEAARFLFSVRAGLEEPLPLIL